MTFLPNESRWPSIPLGEPEIASLFSEERFIHHMLEVEAALAQVQGQLGVIPADAAARIIAGINTFQVDVARVREGLERSGVPVIELVRQLRQHVAGEAANYVHWGATSQDIVDSATLLQVRAALSIMESWLHQLLNGLAQLAQEHRRTLMAGRTHGQQALPIPFGLKVAGWMAPLVRHQQRLGTLKSRLMVVQFGGAAGTLASLGKQGMAVMEGLASELELSVPPMPWHTQRDNLAELAGWLSMVTASLAKMAQDIILMAQSEIGELQESSDSSRGGSSTMPQKQNPVTSEVIIAAARSNAALLGNMHQAMIQEHERATHGWQLEWLTLPQMFTLTAVALKKATFLINNLAVNSEGMAANVAASYGLMLAEAVSFVLAPTYMSREEAGHFVREACRIALRDRRNLLEVIKERVNVPVDWETLPDESEYFGSADRFIDRVLDQVAAL